MLVLHQFEISPFCDKIRRVLRFKKLPFETREVTLFDASSGALRRRNGTGKLPTLDHDGALITDSTDIARHLEERFPEHRLIPSDPRLAAECHILEDWADESLYFYEAYLRFVLRHNARRWIPALLHKDGAALRAIAPLVVPRVLAQTLHQQGIGRRGEQRILAEVDRHLAALDAKLTDRAWLVGDAITLADIAVFAQLFCIRGADEGERAITGRPAVASWMARVDDATS